MTRTPLAFHVTDISALARHIVAALRENPDPSHLEMMNTLARGAGFRNFQHLRASAQAGSRPQTAAPMADQTRVTQALRHFDAQGGMVSWPSKTNLQHLCLWAIWARLPKALTLSERAFSQLLSGLHSFGDPAILRRTLWELRLIHRSQDGRDYQRVEQAPPAEAAALIHHLSPRWGQKMAPRGD